MSLELRITELTQATESLLEEVNTRKIDLDLASATATARAAEATTSASSAVAASSAAVAAASTANSSAVAASSASTTATNAALQATTHSASAFVARDAAAAARDAAQGHAGAAAQSAEAAEAARDEAVAAAGGMAALGAEALRLTDGGLTLSGNSLTAGQAAQVRAGLFFDGGEVNFLDFVGSNNGLTDHYPALSALIDSLQSQPNSVGAAPVIYFPRGQWLLSGSVANSDAKRFSIRGDGPQATIIRRPAGATGDLFTLNAKGTYVRDLFIEGGRYQGVSGDSVVLNAPYTLCQNLFINKSGGSGVVVGKAGSAIAHVLENLIFRENAGYGIHVIAGSDSTDGMWSNVEIGNSGKHGVLLGTGSQNISNIHVWGSGLESDTETDGISIQSGGNLLNGWQSEKNLGRGVRIQSNNNVLSGGRAWGNCLGAVYVLGASNNNIVGNNFHQNSVLNTSGTTSTAFAAVFLDGAATRNTISGNMFWDNTNALPAGDYVTAPTYPYPGRTAVRTHAILIAETGTADLNSYLSNVAQRELTRLNSTTPPFILIGNGNNVSGNDWGVIPVPVRSVSSGAVRAPAEYDYISVTSSASITSVLGHRAGRVIRIHFANATPGTVVDNGGTLNLKGDYAPTTNDILTLISDGTNWTEVART